MNGAGAHAARATKGPRKQNIRAPALVLGSVRMYSPSCLPAPPGSSLRQASQVGSAWTWSHSRPCHPGLHTQLRLERPCQAGAGVWKRAPDERWAARCRGRRDRVRAHGRQCVESWEAGAACGSAGNEEGREEGEGDTRGDVAVVAVHLSSSRFHLSLSLSLSLSPPLSLQNRYTHLSRYFFASS